MDWDKRAEHSHRADSLAWSSKFNEARGGPLSTWLSTFRNGLPCEIVRFAVPGKVMNGDEKIRSEVATMRFIKTETTIPIPLVIAWGTAILEECPEPEHGPILKSGIDEKDLETVYRQVANILLQLSEHDFSQIGSLSTIDDTHSCAASRPLTLKLNEIESHGGVFVGDNTSRTFSSATEYFHHVADQGLRHLVKQPNSIDNVDDARSKYTYCSILKAIISHFVSSEHDRGPFKLICDDMRFGNMLVNNAKDLKIVAVLDWEWAYTAPYQMLYSPPRWLLIKKPIHCDADDNPEVPYLSQYKSQFQKFLQILEVEERQRARDMGRTLTGEIMSSLMRKSMDDGKFWFHELVYSCFESPSNPAWAAIREIIPNLDELSGASDTGLSTFVNDKMEQLRLYDVEWTALKEEIDREAAEFEALKRKIEEEDANEI
ncbi:hypothetical protein V495_02450 [Pseudogymnoascus sp. VKM F-4514 (FW-929)]|nr:hypothetical protein V495_02450 [Pseudogymnoascus sp. VKM F-4514 (FW-929)]KFY54084.1 hypothetical protein V497_07966 [Pseudogymnoascus sp. VKM F-4516 (FW-969)]